MRVISKLRLWILMIPLLTLAYGEWVPVYKGVDYQEVILTEPGKFEPIQTRVHVMRLSLKEEGLSLVLSEPGADGVLRGERTSTFLKKNGLQVAINGTGYTPASNEAEGATKRSSAYAVFNGKKYGNGGNAAFVVTKDGKIEILKESEYDRIAANDIFIGLGGWSHESVSSLIVDGGKAVYTTDKGNRHARTSIGLSEDGETMYLVVVDGPPRSGFWFSDKISVGMRIDELSKFMASVGCYRALSLDGGGSSTMVMEGDEGVIEVNLPSDYNTGKARVVGTNLGVATEALDKRGNLNILSKKFEEAKALKDRLYTTGLADMELYYGMTLIQEDLFAETDTIRSILNPENLIRAGKKPTGASSGGVFRDEDGIVWFIKKGQHPEYEYLASVLMTTLYGHKAPLVKLVDAEKKLTASRHILGFLQKKDLPKDAKTYGDGRLRIALDWLGIVDRHGRNMGYIRRANEFEATRVDFDHSFAFITDPKVRDSRKYDTNFDEDYLIDLVLKYPHGELLEMLKQIKEIPTEVIETQFKIAVEQLDYTGFRFDKEKIKRIFEKLLERKELIGKLYDEALVSPKIALVSSLKSESLDTTLYSKDLFTQEQWRAVFADAIDNNNEVVTRNVLRIAGDRVVIRPHYLESAVLKANKEMVELLLKAGADPRTDNSKVFLSAAESGHTEIVKLLLDAGADARAENSKALQQAVENGHTGTVKILLAAGADPNVQDSWPLRAAAQNGHVEIMKLLLDVGTDPNANSLSLVIAAQNGHIEIVKVLLAAETSSFSKMNALIYASEKGYTEIVKLLLSAGADPTVLDSWPLTIAATNGHIEVVKVLLSAGADPISQNSRALSDAAKNGYTEILRILLDAGADPMAHTPNALSNAVEGGHLNTVKLLLNAEVNPKSVSQNALSAALGGGHTKTVKLLLNAGVELKEAKQAIYNAAKRGHMESVKLLLNAGAKPEAVTYALSDAVRNGHTETVKLLLDAGADPKAVSRYALSNAVEDGHTETVKLLLDAGADPKAVNSSSLKWAAVRGHTEIVKLLEAAIAKTEGQ